MNLRLMTSLRKWSCEETVRPRIYHIGARYLLTHNTYTRTHAHMLPTGYEAFCTTHAFPLPPVSPPHSFQPSGGPRTNQPAKYSFTARNVNFFPGNKQFRLAHPDFHVPLLSVSPVAAMFRKCFNDNVPRAQRSSQQRWRLLKVMRAYRPKDKIQHTRSAAIRCMS